jgi:hypothetical protein
LVAILENEEFLDLLICFQRFWKVGLYIAVIGCHEIDKRSLQGRLKK